MTFIMDKTKPPGGFALENMYEAANQAREMSLNRVEISVNGRKYIRLV
jgi:hypothetical protein